MAKGNKVNIAITLDSWVANWLNEQSEKRSTLINQVIKDHIVATDPESKKQKRLLPMTPADKKIAFEAHMKRLNAHLDAMALKEDIEGTNITDHLANIEKAFNDRRDNE